MGRNKNRHMSDSEAEDSINRLLTQSGERDRLRAKLSRNLEESGWRDQVKLQVRKREFLEKFSFFQNLLKGQRDGPGSAKHVHGGPDPRSDSDRDWSRPGQMSAGPHQGCPKVSREERQRILRDVIKYYFT